MSSIYVPRLADALIVDLLAEFPALLLVGPRASGKTTTALRHVRTVIRLDEPRQAALVAADPDAVLRHRPEPILIDEWQLVPSVLGAVKRAVDVDPRPGRFIVTGSVHGRLDAPTWPGTGRLIEVDLGVLSIREIGGLHPEQPPFLDRVALGGPERIAVPVDSLDLRGYLELVVRGGFPEPLRGSARGGLRWSQSYLNQLFTRDVDQLDRPRDSLKLRRFFGAYALNTAGVVPMKTLADAVGIDQRTGAAYESLLADLFVVDAVPAWSTNRLKRLVRTPKRYVVDSGLVAGALQLNAETLLRDGDLVGRLLDTFVYAQLRAERQVGATEPTFHHLRDQNGEHEVDLVVELDAHRVVGIEVKATSAPRASDGRHLAWLRDRLDDRFVAGVVLHTGPGVLPLGDRITAVPISALWT